MKSLYKTIKKIFIHLKNKLYHSNVHKDKDGEFNKLAKSVEIVTGVSFADLISDKKGKYLTNARILFSKFCNEYLNLSPYEISKHIKKNHSTVYYYIKRYKDLLIYEDFRDQSDEIKETMNFNK